MRGNNSPVSPSDLALDPSVSFEQENSSLVKGLTLNFLETGRGILEERAWVVHTRRDSNLLSIGIHDWQIWKCYADDQSTIWEGFSSSFISPLLVICVSVKYSKFSKNTKNSPWILKAGCLIHL